MFCMRMCLVITYEVCNVAINRPAYQISEYPGYTANLANDGRTSTCTRSQSRSLNEINSWWVVDLGYWLTITSVNFTNIDDGCCDRKPQCFLSYCHSGNRRYPPLGDSSPRDNPSYRKYPLDVTADPRVGLLVSLRVRHMC